MRCGRRERVFDEGARVGARRDDMGVFVKIGENEDGTVKKREMDVPRCETQAVFIRRGRTGPQRFTLPSARMQS